MYNMPEEEYFEIVRENLIQNYNFKLMKQTNDSTSISYGR